MFNYYLMVLDLFDKNDYNHQDHSPLRLLSCWYS